MALKHTSPTAGDERPLKQTKLNFSQTMAPQNEPAKTGKAGPSRINTKTATSSKNTIISKAPSKAEHGFAITEKNGNIFDAPDGTIIIHACNCSGSWGAGIAAAFKQHYPNAFKTYKNYCISKDPGDLVQTALLIPPLDGKPNHWIGCLFTSKMYGRGRDSAQQILDATAPSLQDLVKQIVELGQDITEIRMCQINSGLFSVPWEHSRAVIQSLELANEMEIPREIIVYSLPAR